MAYLGNKKVMFSPQLTVVTPTKVSELENDCGYLVADDIESKADYATTLKGYGIKDAYTKSETDIMLLEKASKNSVYTKREIDNALTSGMQLEYEDPSNVFKEYLRYDDITLEKTHYLYVEYPNHLIPNAKYKFKLESYFDYSEMRNFSICVGDIHHPVLQDIDMYYENETYTYIESVEFSLPDVVKDTDKIFFRFDCVVRYESDTPRRPAPYKLFASRLLPCYNKNQVDELIESKADSSDLPTKVSDLENDRGYLVATDIESKADKTKLEVFSDYSTITLEDNTTYSADEPISNLTIEYKTDNPNFIASIHFTLAAEGDITIKLPNTSGYIGGAPTFAKGETWELNIKNGVVVGGLIE